MREQRAKLLEKTEERLGTELMLDLWECLRSLSEEEALEYEEQLLEELEEEE